MVCSCLGQAVLDGSHQNQTQGASTCASLALFIAVPSQRQFSSQDPRSTESPFLELCDSRSLGDDGEVVPGRGSEERWVGGCKHGLFGDEVKRWRTSSLPANTIKPSHRTLPAFDLRCLVPYASLLSASSHPPTPLLYPTARRYPQTRHHGRPPDSPCPLSRTARQVRYAPEPRHRARHPELRRPSDSSALARPPTTSSNTCGIHCRREKGKASNRAGANYPPWAAPPASASWPSSSSAPPASRSSSPPASPANHAALTHLGALMPVAALEMPFSFVPLGAGGRIVTVPSRLEGAERARKALEWAVVGYGVAFEYRQLRWLMGR